jgi:ER-bound oxygenase mpaB/B'/Rubber oxygenase, catalytic domain
MTTTQSAPRREGSLDVPDGLPRGIDLGRINNRDEALSKYGREYMERMTDHALLGDDHAYRAFLDFKDTSKNATWKMFEQALDHGIDSLDDPSDGLVGLFRQLDHVPDWVDFDQLYRGAVAYWRVGAVAGMVLTYSSIGAGFSMYSSTRPVLFSGRLKDASAVGGRLTESFRYVVAAHTPGGMRRDQDGFRLTAKVRMIHAAVRHTLSNSPHWDWEAWGLPISNLDSMNTQAGQFGTQFVDGVRASGIRISDREEEDIFALCRYVGWVIGVPEAVLHTNPDDARMKVNFHKLIELPADDLCRDVVKTIIEYSTEKPPGDVEILPAPVAAFMTTERRRHLAWGLIRTWQPEYVSEMLGVERTPWRFALPAVRPLVSGFDKVSRLLPHDDEAKAFKTLRVFNGAIAVPDGDGKSAEVANPETLTADIAANKGKVPRRNPLPIS